MPSGIHQCILRAFQNYRWIRKYRAALLRSLYIYPEFKCVSQYGVASAELFSAQALHCSYIISDGVDLRNNVTFVSHCTPNSVSILLLLLQICYLSVGKLE